MEWIDVNERKPRNGRVVLVMLIEVSVVGERQYDGVVRTSYFNGDFQDRHGMPWIGFVVTHWMPLPEPPKRVRWKPKDGDEWFLIKANGSPIHFISTIPEMGYQLTNDWKFLGVYRTREEAEAMAEKIRAFVAKEIGEVE